MSAWWSVVNFSHLHPDYCCLKATPSLQDAERFALSTHIPHSANPRLIIDARHTWRASSQTTMVGDARCADKSKRYKSPAEKCFLT